MRNSSKVSPQTDACKKLIETAGRSRPSRRRKRRTGLGEAMGLVPVPSICFPPRAPCGLPSLTLSTQRQQPHRMPPRPVNAFAVTSAEIDQNTQDVNIQCGASVRMIDGPSESHERQLCDAMASVPRPQTTACMARVL